MSLRKAVVVDRDPRLLERLSIELARGGVAVEVLSSTFGLTPDLLALSAPDFLVLDAELPGLSRAALLVIVRSLRARLPLSRVVLTTEGDPKDVQAACGAGTAVARAALVAEGAYALGLAGDGGAVDVRAVIDGVLGREPVATGPVRYAVSIDLFSDHTFWVGRGGQPLGVFVATAVQPPLGEPVQVEIDLMGKWALQIDGRVAWLRARRSFGGRQVPGVGVAMGALVERDRQVVERFLAQREPLTWLG